MKRNDGRFTRERTLGNKNINWKGSNVGYNAVHAWMYRTFGKANRCEDCTSCDRVEWANISGDYKRNRNDWKQLCNICHRKFDGITKLEKEQADEIRKRYSQGETQRPLARAFGVSQMTISNIINNKTQYYVT